MGLDPTHVYIFIRYYFFSIRDINISTDLNNFTMCMYISMNLSNKARTYFDCLNGTCRMIVMSLPIACSTSFVCLYLVHGILHPNHRFIFSQFGIISKPSKFRFILFDDFSHHCCSQYNIHWCSFRILNSSHGT